MITRSIRTPPITNDRLETKELVAENIIFTGQGILSNNPTIGVDDDTVTTLAYSKSKSSSIDITDANVHRFLQIADTSYFCAQLYIYNDRWEIHFDAGSFSARRTNIDEPDYKIYGLNDGGVLYLGLRTDTPQDIPWWINIIAEDTAELAIIDISETFPYTSTNLATLDTAYDRVYGEIRANTLSGALVTSENSLQVDAISFLSKGLIITGDDGTAYINTSASVDDASFKLRANTTSSEFSISAANSEIITGFVDAINPSYVLVGSNLTVAAGSGRIRSADITWEADTIALDDDITIYIYADATGLHKQSSVTADDYYEKIFLFEAYYDSVNARAFITRENHPYNFSVSVSNYLHRNVGTVVTGGVLSSGDAATLTITGGTIEDHGIIDTISAGGISAQYLYFDTAWRFGASITIVPLQYSNAGVPTALVAGQYANIRMYVVKAKGETDVDVAQFVGVFDTTTYASIADAENAAESDLPLKATGEMRELEFAQLGFVIVSSTQIESIIDARATFATQESSATINSHLTLDGLNASTYGDGGHTNMVVLRTSAGDPSGADKYGAIHVNTSSADTSINTDIITGDWRAITQTVRAAADPTALDIYPVGTQWINTTAETIFVCSASGVWQLAFTSTAGTPLDAPYGITTDTIDEHTLDAGVTIEGIALKDGNIESLTPSGATLTGTDVGTDVILAISQDSAENNFVALRNITTGGAPDSHDAALYKDGTFAVTSVSSGEIASTSTMTIASDTTMNIASGTTMTIASSSTTDITSTGALTIAGLDTVDLTGAGAMTIQGASTINMRSTASTIYVGTEHTGGGGDQVGGALQISYSGVTALAGSSQISIENGDPVLAPADMRKITMGTGNITFDVAANSMILTDTALEVDTITELTTDAGVTVESVLLKDGEISAVTAITGTDAVVSGIDTINDADANTLKAESNCLGFVDRAETTVAFAPDGSSFTITPTGASFTFFTRNGQITKTAPETVLFPAGVEIRYIIYYNDAGVLTAESVTTAGSSITAIRRYTIVGSIYRNPTTLIYSSDERRLVSGMNNLTKYFVGTKFGMSFLEGFAITDITASGTGNDAVDIEFKIEDGSFMDMDFEVMVNDSDPQILNSDWAEIPIMYFEGTSLMISTATQYPITSGVTANRIGWNYFNGATWEKLDVDSGNFVIYHYFATKNIAAPIIGVMGQMQHTKLTDAQTSVIDEVNSIIFANKPPFMPLGSVIYEHKTSWTNAYRSRVVPVDGSSYQDLRSITFSTSSATTNQHSSLGGLDHDDHFQYALLAGRTGDILAIDDIVEFTADAGVTIEANLLRDGTIASSAGTGLSIGETDITRPVTDSYLAANGGTNGAQITLYGATHATDAGTIALRSTAGASNTFTIAGQEITSLSTTASCVLEASGGATLELEPSGAATQNAYLRADAITLGPIGADPSITVTIDDTLDVTTIQNGVGGNVSIPYVVCGALNNDDSALTYGTVAATGTMRVYGTLEVDDINPIGASLELAGLTVSGTSIEDVTFGTGNLSVAQVVTPAIKSSGTTISFANTSDLVLATLGSTGTLTTTTVEAGTINTTTISNGTSLTLSTPTVLASAIEAASVDLTGSITVDTIVGKTVAANVDIGGLAIEDVTIKNQVSESPVYLQTDRSGGGTNTFTVSSTDMSAYAQSISLNGQGVGTSGIEITDEGVELTGAMQRIFAGANEIDMDSSSSFTARIGDATSGIEIVNNLISSYNNSTPANTSLSLFAASSAGFLPSITLLSTNASTSSDDYIYVYSDNINMSGSGNVGTCTVSINGTLNATTLNVTEYASSGDLTLAATENIILQTNKDSGFAGAEIVFQNDVSEIGSIGETGNMTLAGSVAVGNGTITIADHAITGEADSVLLVQTDVSGPNLEMYGSTHATLANKTFMDSDEISFRSSSGGTLTAFSVNGPASFTNTVGVTGLLTATGGLATDSIAEITGDNGIVIDSLRVKDATLQRATGDAATVDLYGGTGSGGQITLYGASHATKASKIEFVSDVLCAQTIARSVDDGLLAIQADSGSGPDITMYGSGHATNANEAYINSNMTRFNASDGSSATAVYVNGTLYADTIGEYTSDHGVIIDSVTLKDGNISSASADITTINATTVNATFANTTFINAAEDLYMRFATSDSGSPSTTYKFVINNNQGYRALDLAYNGALTLYDGAATPAAIGAITSAGVLTIDTVTELTSDAGVTVEGILLKDSTITSATSAEIGSLTLSGTTIEGLASGGLLLQTDASGPNLEMYGSTHATLADHLYVDSDYVSFRSIAGGDVSEFTVNGSAGITGSLTTTTSVITDVIAERSADAGVTIDGLTIKDGGIASLLTTYVNGDTNLYLRTGAGAGGSSADNLVVNNYDNKQIMQLESDGAFTLYDGVGPTEIASISATGDLSLTGDLSFAGDFVLSGDSFTDPMSRTYYTSLSLGATANDTYIFAQIQPINGNDTFDICVTGDSLEARYHFTQINALPAENLYYEVSPIESVDTISFALDVFMSGTLAYIRLRRVSTIGGATTLHVSTQMSPLGTGSVYTNLSASGTGTLDGGVHTTETVQMADVFNAVGDMDIRAGLGYGATTDNISFKNRSNVETARITANTGDMSLAGSLTTGGVTGGTLSITGDTISGSANSVLLVQTDASGPNIEMYGSTHATLANKTFFDSDEITFRSIAGGDVTTFRVSGPEDVTGTLTCDTINEHTTDAGVTVESVLLKDGEVSDVVNITGTANTDSLQILIDTSGPNMIMYGSAHATNPQLTYFNSNNITFQNSAGSGALTSFKINNSLNVDTITEFTTDNGVGIEGVYLNNGVVLTDYIREQTTDNGVNIESILIKDHEITATDGSSITFGGDNLSIINAITVTSMFASTISSSTSGLFGSTLTIATGSITDSGGTIDFGSTDLTTTGDIIVDGIEVDYVHADADLTLRAGLGGTATSRVYVKDSTDATISYFDPTNGLVSSLASITTINCTTANATTVNATTVNSTTVEADYYNADGDLSLRYGAGGSTSTMYVRNSANTTKLTLGEDGTITLTGPLALRTSNLSYNDSTWNYSTGANIPTILTNAIPSTGDAVFFSKSNDSDNLWVLVKHTSVYTSTYVGG